MTGTNGSKIQVINYWSKIHHLFCLHALVWLRCMNLWPLNSTTSLSSHAGETCKTLTSPKLWRLSISHINLQTVPRKYSKLSWTWLSSWSLMRFQTLCSARKHWLISQFHATLWPKRCTTGRKSLKIIQRRPSNSWFRQITISSSLKQQEVFWN